MKQTKLAAIIAATLPIGAAAEMLPETEPIDWKRFSQACKDVMPEAYGIPGMNTQRDSGRREAVSGPRKGRMVHRNRNILSSTKPIR